MKKLLAMILIYTLLLIGTTAFAEGSTGIEAQSLTEQLDILERPELHDEIAGTWHCCYLAYADLYTWYLDDIENFFGYYALTFNEDGTATLHNFEDESKDSTYIYYIMYRSEISGPKDLERVWAISIYDKETGEYLFDLKLHEPISGLMYMYEYTDYYVELIYSYNSYGYENSFFFIKDPLPATEPAAVNTASTLNDFDGRWELVAANCKDRAVDYDTYALNGYYSDIGMMCEVNTSSDSMVIEYADGWWNGYGLSEPEDGIIVISNSENWRGDASVYIGVDGNLYVEQHYMTLVFQRQIIDPMTEYTDTNTTMLVQRALNSLGYDCGTPDGVSGKKTETAITAFQTDNELTITGTITEETLECLRGYGFIF